VVVESVVVGDHDLTPHLAGKASCRLDSELGGFLYGLVTDRKRGQDQNAPSSLSSDVFRPGGLHERFSETAISEDRGAAFPAGEFDQGTLEVESILRHPQRIETIVTGKLSFSFEEFRVAVHDFAMNPDRTKTQAKK